LLATDPVLAGAQAEEILSVVGEHPMALLLLGASHSARGNHAQATEILSALGQAQPDWALAQLELGIALGRAGRGGDAVPALRNALRLKPDLPRAWQALGDHLSAMGDSAGADEA
jgi:Flp pilus assembly protein TadD